MAKRKMNWIGFHLMVLMLFSAGCEYWDNLTNSGSGSNSGSSTNASTNSGSTPPPKTEPAHGPATVNILEKSPFSGADLNSTYWSDLEAYCKAGPTQLIIADMDRVPSQMSRAGFGGRWTVQCYALGSTMAGMDWSPKPGDAEGEALSRARGQIDAWWSRYINAVVQVMQKAPQTTAVIIVNDSFDELGIRLGPATYRAMGSVQGRVQIGHMEPEPR
jgi:hypothetical protein